MKITLVLPYFGKWPAWFDAFLLSCKHNPEYEWLLFSDCPMPGDLPANVRFIPFTIEAFNQLASDKLNLHAQVINPYKLCDFKSAYGVIFSDYLQDSEFWGHCDLDVVWGKISRFITPEILADYDFITTRKEHIAGHFTLYRNFPTANQLFLEKDGVKEIFESLKFIGFNENGMRPLVARASAEGRLRVYWPRYLFNFAQPKNNAPSRLGPLSNHWQWKNGHIYENGQEVMYLHFMTWKHSLQKCYFTYQDAPESFYISYSHISTKNTDQAPPGALLSWWRRQIPRMFKRMVGQVIYRS